MEDAEGMGSVELCWTPLGADGNPAVRGRGRLDECGAGGMWNSNSPVAWLLAPSGLPVDLVPPDGGRAPGWTAGPVVAARTRVHAI